MSVQILSTSPSFGFYSRRPVELLRNEGYGLEFLPQGEKATEDLIGKYIAEKDALIAGVEPITAQVLEKANRLKIIAKHGVGVDNIDLEYARHKGIYVTNAPGTNSHAVADLTFALLLGLARQIPVTDLRVKEGEWPRVVGTELWGKTIGIIGLGQIGKLVARRAKGFDMRILAYDVYSDHEYADQHGITFVSLDTLLEQSDFVSIHIPHTEQTQNLIGTSELKRMKKSALICNLSRGGIINEKALYDALVQEDIAGAGLDVFDQEPPSKAHPLLQLPNVIATPHMGAYTNESLERVGMITAHNIIKTMRSQTPDHIMNGL
ncbi:MULTISPECIES: phosphoglycerate dehydrogenase [unclassified Paenibacillus]|uniref:phosphoglycerate dehydrogenase n=1 Tax=unclassified Paenibacillus TaxID=185978 RepID=UPI001AEB53D0|nr:MULTISPECIES: phosphoglycerate dehydrogenase [unclassified Paenibacillus]MBP1157014.1 D-3-phosphoglycerate dehydrogenase [Paenibacillus sp. PvP091]MBP1172247.1 D-3-phosphoglycerate dehydrogenase [Paenibacillus sp. PvR098]MBP2438628.1 D-3-phosphoglycerate dehydrogenase [Paenibacillus sp. PvP052]